jgi:hypothetical protein
MVVARALVWTLSVYSAIVALHHFVVFLQRWSYEQEQLRQAQQEWQACERAAAVGEMLKFCQAVRLRTDRSPLLESLLHVLSNIYLCGNTSCVDLALKVLNSTPGILLIMVLGAGVTFSLAYSIGGRYDRVGATPNLNVHWPSPAGNAVAPPPPAVSPFYYQQALTATPQPLPMFKRRHKQRDFT